jgi:hypothetical protein
MQSHRPYKSEQLSGTSGSPPRVRKRSPCFGRRHSASSLANVTLSGGRRGLTRRVLAYSEVRPPASPAPGASLRLMDDASAAGQQAPSWCRRVERYLSLRDPGFLPTEGPTYSFASSRLTSDIRANGRLARRCTRLNNSLGYLIHARRNNHITSRVNSGTKPSGVCRRRIIYS